MQSKHIQRVFTEHLQPLGICLGERGAGGEEVADLEAWDLYLSPCAYPEGKKFMFWMCFPTPPLPGRLFGSGGMCLAESHLSRARYLTCGRDFTSFNTSGQTCENCIALNIRCTLQQPCSLSMNHQHPARAAVLEVICTQQIDFLAPRGAFFLQLF